MHDTDAEFIDFASARAAALRRTAFLLCGDWHQAEDIVQVALAKLYVAWRKVSRREAVDAYARQIVVRVFLDERRRGWAREHPTDQLPDRASAAADQTEERIVLLTALAQVPRQQRAVLVLRFWEDMSVADTAEALRCSEGNVKSQTSRGLDTLRLLIGSSPDTLAPEQERTGT